MAKITITVTDEEKEWLKYMADFYGISLSNLIKKYSMEQLEDEYDKQVADIAYKRYKESGEKSYPIEDILKEFGGLNE
jgi:hypothetical protein